MSRKIWIAIGLAAGLALAPSAAGARAMGVEVWTDRGSDAVYQPGDIMQVKTRASEDAYLLVYELDSEGSVRLLYPYGRGTNGFVEGRRTYEVPPDDADIELVVENPVGQGFVVAIASSQPFKDLPWYLRPYDPQAAGVGYEGQPDDEDGVTAEGRVVGDPYVAMERIRRRVLDNPEDRDGFATSYTTYYVHHEVRYPRYVCYDCHRPGRWAWWDGFDPYYTTCSVIDLRVNWQWCWGPGYWYGNVPYYFFVYRNDCPPRYRVYLNNRNCYSSWDGWHRWYSMWPGCLTRYKSPPPPGYVPPVRYGDRRPDHLPPGYLSPAVYKGPGRGLRESVPIGRNDRPRQDIAPEGRGGLRRPDVTRGPAVEAPRDDNGRRSGLDRPRERPMPQSPSPRWDPAPRSESPRSEPPRVDRPREERPAPRYQPPREERPREERPAPRYQPPREERPRETPHRDPPRGKSDRSDDRGERGSGRGGRDKP